DEDPAALPRIVPVYEKPTAMHPGAMRRIAQAAVEEFAERVPSALPPAVAARQRVIDLPRALRHVHTPAPEADLQALGEVRSLAHRSLIFDELFFLQLGLALRRSAAGQEPGTAFPPSTRLVPALQRRLPFRSPGSPRGPSRSPSAPTRSSRRAWPSRASGSPSSTSSIVSGCSSGRRSSAAAPSRSTCSS